MVKIAVLASFNMDLVMRASRLPQPGETLQGDFAMFLGGKGFNQAVAARRLGAEVAVIGRVGDDEFGRAFLDALDTEGIDRAGVAVTDGVGTGVASIVVDDRGENAIIQAPRANRALTGDDVRAAARALEGAAAGLFQFETSPDASTAFHRLCREAGCLTVLNPAPHSAIPADGIPAVDILVPNAIEARVLAHAPPDIPLRELAQMLRERGANHVAVTVGGDGAVAAAPIRTVDVPAFGVPVVDTVGAGDAFCAALAVRMAEGAEFAEAVRFACAAGALACTQPGAAATMPQRRDVEALIAKGASG